MGRLSLMDAPGRIFKRVGVGSPEGYPASDWIGLHAHHLRAMAAATILPQVERRVGVITNGKAHRNLARAKRETAVLPSAWTAPQTHGELSDTLASFAAQGINALIIDGGDGTVREVITAALPHFPKAFPTLAVVPSGKTNALALDLGTPTDWTVTAAVDAIRNGRIKQRAPLEIWRNGSTAPDLRGFLFGAGAFVRATKLAQRVHRLGAINSLAVGLSLASAITQTYFGKKGNVWREGESMRIETADGQQFERSFYIVLGSTLERLPLGIKPFGANRGGMKLLGIDAPPQRMLVSVPMLLAGSEAQWLARAGYHRTTAETLGLSLKDGFILDGEFYPGGDLILKKGTALNFATP